MEEMRTGRSNPALTELVAEASQALARLDATRLEELALSCLVLNRNMSLSSFEERCRLARQAREAASDMEVFARVLEVTRSNLRVMQRLRDLREGRVEYSEAQALGWAGAESGHGDN